MRLLPRRRFGRIIGITLTAVLVLIVFIVLSALRVWPTNSMPAEQMQMLRMLHWIRDHWFNSPAATAWGTILLALATFLLVWATIHISKRERSNKDTAIATLDQHNALTSSAVSPTAQPASMARIDDQPFKISNSASIPQDISNFTGRRELIEALCRHLSSTGDSASTISLLHGPPGVGKTTLAIHVAHLIASNFIDGQIFVELRDAHGQPRDPYIVLEELLTYLSVPVARIPRDRRLRTALYRSMLEGKRKLIILDNAVSEDQLRDLLPTDRSSQILITSRSTLGSLQASRYLVQAFDASTGLEFLTKIVGEERVEQEPRSAEHIVQLCGGLPLSLWITGAKTAVRPHFDLAHIAEALEQETGRLDELALGVLRSRSILSWSYTDLDNREQMLFRMLAIITVPNFPSWVASALLNTSINDGERILQRLVDAHLIAAKERDQVDQIRYGFHDLVRELATERLHAEESAESIALALGGLANCYLQHAQEANRATIDPLSTGEHGNPIFPSLRSRRDWWTAERAALVSLVELTSIGEMWQLCLDIGLCVAPYLEESSHWRDLEVVYEHGMNAALELGDRRSEERVLQGLGIMLRDRGDFQESAERLQAALAICHDINDLSSEAKLRGDIGVLYQYTGQFEAAIREFGESLRLFDAEGDEGGAGWALRSLGQVYRDLGNFDLAEESLGRALAIFDQRSDRRGRGWVMRALGEVYRLQERLADSETQLLGAVAALADAGDDRGRAWALRALGDLRLQQSMPEEARKSFERGLRIFRRLGDRRGIAWTARSLGDMYRIGGEYEMAVASFTESRDFFRESGAREWEAIALRGLAETFRDEGSLDNAIKTYRDSIKIFHDVSDDRREGRALLDVAKIYDKMKMSNDAEVARNRARQLSDAD